MEEQKEKAQKKQSKIINKIKKDFEIAIDVMQSSTSVKKGEENWYIYCGFTMRKLVDYMNLFNHEDAIYILIEHLFDLLLYDEKIEIINYIYDKDVFEPETFEYYVKILLDSRIIRTKNLTSIILFFEDKIHVMVLKNKKWTLGEELDKREVLTEFALHADIKTYKINPIIGFVNYEQKNRYLVFKVKDMNAKRNTGARCDEAAKTKKIQILKDIMGEAEFNRYNELEGKITKIELCCLEEFLFRYYNKIKKNNNLWFFNFELAMLLKKELKI